MGKTETLRKWSDLNGMDVAIRSEGRVAGQLVNFFFAPESGAIKAFRVHTRINGDFALPVSAIKSIDTRLTIDTATMLLKAMPNYPAASDLRSLKVVGEDGTEVGTAAEFWLALDPPVAPRLVAIELADTANKHARSFRISAVSTFEPNTVVIDSKIARRLR